MPCFIQAETPEQIARIRELFLEYNQYLGIDLDFQDFERELASLPGEYSPPSGRLLLIECEGRTAGCAAVRRLQGDICEMKRMYLRPEFRGRGIGRRVAEYLIDEARAVGCRKMRLDTLPHMTEAIALYHSLGFKTIPPYRYNPFEGAVFLEVNLEAV